MDIEKVKLNCIQIVYQKYFQFTPTGSYNVFFSGDSRDVTISRCNLHDGDGGVSLDGKNLPFSLKKNSIYGLDMALLHLSKVVLRCKS